MAKIREEIGLSYDDVLLVPKQGVVVSRSDVILSCKITSNLIGKVPIISAPMSSVTEGKMALNMWLNDAYGILHRFMTPEDQAAMFKQWMPGDEFSKSGYNNLYAGAALGIGEGVERFWPLYQVGCRVFCIDIAHAHHDSVARFIDRINGVQQRDQIQLIVGNIATGEAAEFLADLGVDAIKVGIGSGAACTTRIVTGFGVPQLTAIMEVKEAVSWTPIIADGGIKNSGDIVKAIAAGADTVMIGKLLAGTDEAPNPGEYYGMASDRANGELKTTRQDINIYREGVEGIVPMSGPISTVIADLVAGIRSGVSYAGAYNLYGLQDNAEFIRVAPGVAQETGVRI